jgi:hypothetical protein
MSLISLKKFFVPLTLTLTLLIGSSFTAELEENSLERSKKEPEIHKIRAKDIGCHGLRITKPGVYRLMENIRFIPKDPSGSAKIVITDPTGSGATALACVSGGQLRGVNLLKGGQGYTNPRATVRGDGCGAKVVPLYSGLTSVSIIDGGFGYVPGDVTATISGGGGSGATAIPIPGLGGTIIAFNITDPGSGYTSAPTITLNQTIGAGAGFVGTANISEGQIVGFHVIESGVGYPETVQSAITIASSDVKLELESYRISLEGVDESGNVTSAQKPYVCGILIPDQPDHPIQSVTIAGGDNAIIDGFSLFGIRVFGNTKDIQISNVTIKNCGKLAAVGYPTPIRPFQGYFPAFFLPTVEHPINGLQPAVPFTVGGLCIGEENAFGLGPQFFTQHAGTQNRVEGLILNNVYSLGNFNSALEIGNSTNISVDGCHFDDTFSDDPNLTLIAVNFGLANNNDDYPNAILNMTFKNSTVNNTIQATQDPSKAYITELLPQYTPFAVEYTRGSNSEFINCQFDNTTTTFPGDINATTTGNFLNSANTNCSWINCSFDNASSITCTEAFHISGHDYEGTDQVSQEQDITSARNCILIGCTANNAVSNGQLQLPAPILLDPVGYNNGTLACGFAFFYVKNLYLEDCLAMNSTSYGYLTPVADAAQGFYIGGGGSVNTPFNFEGLNTVFKNCIASRATAVNGGNAEGFLLENYAVYTEYNMETLSLDGCISQGNQALVPSGAAADILGAEQGTGCGFTYYQELGAFTGYPVSYTNCKAQNNKGVPRIDLTFNDTGDNLGAYYSAGFFALGQPNFAAPGFAFGPPYGGPELVQGHTYFNCEATDNVYGFLFSQADRMVVRNCRSDLNVAVDGLTGEGFTDIGIDIRYDGTTAAGSTLTTINLDPITAPATLPSGLFLQFTSGANSVANVAYAFPILSYSGAPNYQVTIGPSFFPAGLIAPPAAGDHLYILGTDIGSPATPLRSTSLFQANSAFANGAGYTAVGQNGNYNVRYGPALTPIPVLNSSLSVPPFFPSSATYMPATNISITN